MIVGVFCAVLLTMSAFAASTNTPVTIKTVKAESPNSWVFSIGGSGATTTKGVSQSAFGADLSLGRTFTLLLPIEAGFRQSFGYASKDGGNVDFFTDIYVDGTLFTIKKVNVDVFVGGNAGLYYGNIPTTWTVAPEAGLRWWMKKDVALVGRVEYPFTVDSSMFKEDGALKYYLGVLVKF